MSETKNCKNKNFGFKEIVIELFGWLEKYDYCVSEANSTRVRYKGPLGFVNIYYGRSSHEIAVEIGPSGSENIAIYSMSELIRLKDDKEAKSYRNPVAKSSEHIKRFVAIQAQRLKVYGQPIFTRDTMVWRELEQQKKLWSEEYAMDVLLSQVRSEADLSFREHNFKRVIELLSPVEHRLTPAECKKLDYSRRKLGAHIPKSS